LTTPPGADLLSDLARLVRKHGPEEWKALLAWLEDDSKRIQVVSLIRQLSEISSERAPARKRSESAPTVQRILEDIQKQDPAKGELLRGLYHKLLIREFLPTSLDLRGFAEAAGVTIPLGAKIRREQSINALVRELARLPYERLEQVMAGNWAVTRRDLGNEYQSLSSFILGQKQSQDD
jgi:hypothetical protein